LESINNTGTAASGYFDYTSLSTDLVLGLSYDIIITNGHSYTSDDLGIWIDWNQDGYFTDANENVVCTNGDGAQGTYSFTVPSNATLGATTMRIRIKYSGSDCGSPCGTTTYGEVEDYKIVVKGIVSENITVENETIISGQTECYNATNTITVAGAGTTVDVESGGEAYFIAGENILLKPGFHSHSGSSTYAYITLTGDYCSSLPPIIAAPDSILGEPLLTELFSDHKAKYLGMLAVAYNNRKRKE